AGRPPTGRRRRRAPPPPPPKEASELSLDPYQLAIQHVQSEENTGAVMNVDATAEFDATFDDGVEDSLLHNEDAQSGGDSTTAEKKSKPFWNPHYSHALLVGVVAAFFIAVFGYYISSASAPMQQTEKHVDKVAVQALATADRLLDEMYVASQVMSTVVFAVANGQENTGTFLEDVTNALASYQDAMRSTDDQISLLLRTHEEYLSSMVGGIGVLVESALDIATLSRIRNAVRSGGDPSSIMPSYDDVVQGVMTFSSRLVVSGAFRDPNDRHELQAVVSAMEGQLEYTGALLTNFLNAWSVPAAGALKSFTASSDFEVSWKLDALSSVVESFLRYGVSSESYLSSATTNTTASAYRSGSNNLNYIALPSTLYTLLNAEETESYSGQAFTWNSTYGAVLLGQIPSGLVATATLNVQFDEELDDRNSSLSIVLVTVLLILFIISVIAIFGHIASVIHYAQNEDSHAAREREVRTLQRSLTRMTTFAQKVSKLDVTAVAAIIRRAHRSRTATLPTEELQLYNSMTTLRDKEYFLPVTVTHPPADIPKAALSKSGNLFVKPALAHVRSAVAVRMSLSTFHNAFQTAGSKQKAVQ
ncbi:transmembrane protein, putative, partial [Bodo saltans]